MHTAILLLAKRPEDLFELWEAPPQPVEPDAMTATLLFDQITVTAELGGKITGPEIVTAVSGREAAVVMRAMTHAASVTLKADTSAALDQALASIGDTGAALLWRPESGAMELLGRRAAPSTPPSGPQSDLARYDPAMDSEAMYLLLDEEPTSLGQVLADHMPNRAAELSRTGAMSTVVRFPDDGARVKLLVVGPIDSDDLATHAGGEAPRHGAAVQILASGPTTDLDLVMYQVSFAGELARRPEAAGVWIPWQERFEPAGTILGEDQDTLPHVAIHSGHADDMDVLYTRGMRRFRGRELISEDPGPEYPIAPLMMLICGEAVDSGQLPQPDGRAESGLEGWDVIFHDFIDPWSEEPALNIELIEQGSSS